MGLKQMFSLEITKGRTLKRGLTLRSSTIALVGIIGVMIGLGALLRTTQETFAVEAHVLGREVIENDAACTLAVEVEIVNMSDRRMVFSSARFKNIEGSDRSILASVASGESAIRTYLYPLQDCEDVPSSIDAGSLVLDFSPTSTNYTRSITAD